MKLIKTAISIAAALLVSGIGIASATGNVPVRHPLQKKSPTASLFRQPVNQKKASATTTKIARAGSPRKFIASEVSYYTSLCEVTLGSPIGYANLKSDIHADAGGALVGDTYYCIEQVAGSIFTVSAYEADTWEQKSSIIVYGYDFFAHDLTYDPVDQKIYGCFMKTNENGETDGFVWGWLDTENLERKAIADLPKSLAAVAAAPDGTVYAIDYEGELSTVNKSNGQLTRIADTGLKSELATGGVIDPKTGILYYVTQTNADMPMIYAVNVTDGTSEPVGALDEYQQLRGMSFPAPKASDYAPAAVTEIDMQFMGDALMGMAVITMPTETYAGEQLDGQLSYTVTVNGEQYSTGTANPGDKQYEFIEFPAPGMYTVAVTVSNENGTSPVYEVTGWFGLDDLNAIRKVDMTEEDGNVQLSWEAATPMHGGYFDEELVTYDVTRLPDNMKIASDIKGTDCTDHIDKGQELKTAKWRVDLKYDGEVKSSATSKSVVSGNVAEVPFRTSFETADEFSFFSVIDANGDNMKWDWLNFYDLNQCAGLKSHETNAGDDWLITPGIRMKGGSSYKVSFAPACYMPWCPERIEVKYGIAPAAEAMTGELVAPMTVDKTKSEADRVVAVFEPETDGIYYFGFHGISDPYEFYLVVDDIAITESDGNAPALPTEFTVVADSMGGSSAEISFVTPAKTENGSDLEQLNLVELRRDGKIINSWDNPAPGVSLNYKDEDETLAGTNHTYTVISSNESGESAPSSVKVYVGEDNPDRVANLKAIENEDGTVTISWDCPERGENGGYINPDNVTYMVSRHFAADGRVVTLASTKETSYTDKFEAGEQTVLNYMVRPQNGVGMGRWLDTETLVLGGTPMEYPFAESASEGTASHPLWGSENHGTKGAWYLAETGVAPVCAPQDGDGGMFEFVPEAIGDKSRLTSGNIDASTAENPVLTFWYYAAGSNRLSVQINPDNSGWRTLETFGLSDSGKEGWTKMRVSLTDLGAKRSLRLGFLAEAAEIPNGVYIDNIRLYDAYSRNLGISSAEFPESVAAGKDMTARLTVENSGTETIDNGKIELMRNGESVGIFDIPSLASGESTIMEVAETTDASMPSRVLYSAAVSLDGDADDSDNYASSTVEILYGYDLPAPSGLKGDVNDGEVILSWNKPAEYSGTKDSFENYEPFGFLTSIGPWHSIDGNSCGKITPVDGDKAVEFPTAGLSVGFQVFDARSAGMQSHDLDGRTGSRVMAAFADKTGANSDWLISPEIKGGTEVVLYAKGGSRYFEEQFEVLYSSTDRSRESFSAIGETRKVSADWTEIRFSLPEDARYFAIRYCSFDCYALLIDDISYTSTAGDAVLTGYNLYKDGALFASTESAGYTDTADSEHTYAVTAVYDMGESLMSESILIKSNDVESIGADSHISVIAKAGALYVTGADGLEMRVWRADGTSADSRICGASECLRLEHGVYIVAIEGQTWKIRI